MSHRPTMLQMQRPAVTPSFNPAPKQSKRIVLPIDEYKFLCQWVMARDRWKCRMPGCKARQGLSAHHIVFRSQQGDDASYNMLTLCIEHHDAVHRYELLILPQVDGEKVNANKGVHWRFA